MNETFTRIRFPPSIQTRPMAGHTRHRRIPMPETSDMNRIVNLPMALSRSKLRHSARPPDSTLLA